MVMLQCHILRARIVLVSGSTNCQIIVLKYVQFIQSYRH